MSKTVRSANGTIASEMTVRRAEELSTLSNRRLVDVVENYFAENATMPGEKEIKTYAAGLKKELAADESHELTDSARRDLIEGFASACVKEEKVTLLTDKNGAYPVPDEVTALVDGTEPIPFEGGAASYAIPVHFDDNEYITAAGSRYKIEFAASGFTKNHPGVAGMDGTLVATDYSNGKHVNMGYVLCIDLSQNLTPEIGAEQEEFAAAAAAITPEEGQSL